MTTWAACDIAYPSLPGVHNVEGPSKCPWRYILGLTEGRYESIRKATAIHKYEVRELETLYLMRCSVKGGGGDVKTGTLRI